MAAFIIFDQASGAVKGSYTLTNAASLQTSMKLNTPIGCGALTVPLGHPATVRNKAWRVTAGKLIQATAATPAATVSPAPIPTHIIPAMEKTEAPTPEEVAAALREKSSH